MTQDDLVIVTGLDQSIETDDRNILQQIEDILMEAVYAKDLDKALGICRQLVLVGKLSGLGLAKSLYIINTNWHLFEVDDSFEDIFYEGVGLHKNTIDRYVTVWSMFAEEKIPDKYIENVRSRNMAEQIPVAKMLSQGYEPDEQDWKKLRDAPDFSTLSSVIRDIKGKPPRKSALQIYLGRDGEIFAYKDNKRAYVGYLNIEEDDPITQSAIERIIKNTGIMKR